MRATCTRPTIGSGSFSLPEATWTVSRLSSRQAIAGGECASIAAVIAGGRAHNPLERFVEGAIGIVADGMRDIDQLFVAFAEQPGGLVDAPTCQVHERRLAHEFLEADGEGRAGHAGSRSQAGYRPRPADFFVHRLQCRANLPVGKSSQPARLLAGVGGNVSANRLNQENIGEPPQD